MDVHRVSPRFTFWLTLFQSYMLPLFFNGLLSYLVGMKRRTSSRRVTCKRDNSPFVMCLSPLMSEVHLLVNLFQSYSELAAEGHMWRMLKACASKLYGTAHVSLPSNQIGNKHFVWSLSGSQLMWQICLYLPDQLGKSCHRIQYQNFNSIAWVLYFDFLDNFWL